MPDHTPPGVQFVEVIGQPGEGFVRSDEPSLPSVVFTGDEALHLAAVMGGAAQGVSAHETGRVVDPDCPICAAVWGKLGSLTEAAEEARRG